MKIDDFKDELYAMEVLEEGLMDFFKNDLGQNALNIENTIRAMIDFINYKVLKTDDTNDEKSSTKAVDQIMAYSTKVREYMERIFGEKQPDKEVQIPYKKFNTIISKCLQQDTIGKLKKYLNSKAVDIGHLADEIDKNIKDYIKQVQNVTTVDKLKQKFVKGLGKKDWEKMKKELFKVMDQYYSGKDMKNEILGTIRKYIDVPSV